METKNDLNIETRSSKFLSHIEILQNYILMLVSLFGTLNKIWKNRKEILNEMYLIGAQSFPLIFLGGLFVGIIMSLEVGYRFASFGAKASVGRAVSLAMVRELGPIITALLLASRTGAKNTSEIGGMIISEQIDAMRAFGTNPIEKLVLPRNISSMIMFLPLTLIADAVGILGGLFASKYFILLDPSVYWRSAIVGLLPKDLIVGFLKPVFFGFFISTISCFYGLKTTGGSLGLGRSLINSVVVSSIVILVVDFIFTKVVWEIM
ncbi:MAG TPA: ABC transporter permease [Ignavibacteria bacterium]|nr:ABC transporter permease [Ignavibacteria bacterium]